MEKRELMQGNEACVKGALHAGVNFFAGYPITPSTEIAEQLANELPKVGGVFIQMEDEIASMAAVLGASLTGAKAMTATSGPGFSLKQENIGFGVMTDTPCVVVNVQRLGPSTGGPTLTAQGDVMQARWGTHGEHNIIALSPASVEETYFLTIEAFNFSERYRTPVVLLLDETIGHLRENINTEKYKSIKIYNRQSPFVAPDKYLPFSAEPDKPPVLASFGEGYRYHVTGLVHDETGFPCTGNFAAIDRLLRRLNNKLTAHEDELTLYRQWLVEDAEYLIIAYGASARSAAGAVKMAREEGIKAGLLQVQTLWPFPEKLIYQKSMNKKSVIVPEMNLGQYAGEIKKIVPDKIPVVTLSQVDGSLFHPRVILAYFRGEEKHAQVL